MVDSYIDLIPISNYHMSFQSKADEVQRNLNTVKKDLRTRQDQARKNDPTFFTDTQIKGGFSELNLCLQELERALNDSDSNQRQKDKQRKQYKDLVKARDQLQNTYDGYFEKKAPAIGQYSSNQGDNQTNFQKKYETEGLNAKQLNGLRNHELHQQDQLMDQLLDVAGNMLTTGKQTGQELQNQERMLNTLQQKVDENTNRITKTRGKMMRLLQQSSNKLLILIIIIEIAAVILVWTVWH